MEDESEEFSVEIENYTNERYPLGPFQFNSIFSQVLSLRDKTEYPYGHPFFIIRANINKR
jgi:hypothetical protein